MNYYTAFSMQKNRANGSSLKIKAALLSSATALACLFSAHSAVAATINCTQTLYWCGMPIPNDSDVTITTTGNAGTTPKGYGIYMDANNHNNNLILNTLTIKTDGYNSDAIATKSEGVFLYTNELHIETKGFSADGINVASDKNNNYDSVVVVKDKLYIETGGGMGVRANNFANAGANSVIILPDSAIIKVQGFSSNNTSDGRGYGVYAGNRDSDSGKNTLGNSYVFLGNNATITTNTTNGHGVYANKGGLVQLGDGVTITTTGTGAYTLYAATEAQLQSNGTAFTDNIRPGYIFLGGGATLRAQNATDIVMQANGKDSIIANKVMDVPDISSDHGRLDRVQGLDKTITTDTSGVFDIEGNIDAINGGTVSLHMTNTSHFVGTTDKHSDGSEISTINLKIDGANSLWQLTGNSNLTTLDVGTSANVSLDAGTLVTSSNMITLRTDKLIGTGGIFHMRTDMANEVGDLIQVTTASSGTHRIDFVDNKSGGYTTLEELMVVEFTDSNKTLNQAIFTSAGSDVGPYIYKLDQYGDGNWYLHYAPSSPSPDPSPSPNPPELNNTANNAASFIGINYYLGFIENQTLLQRMGELRKAPEKDGEIWMRTFGGGLDHFADKRLSSFDMTYYGVQIGVDKHIDRVENGDLFLGLMAGVIDANIDFNVGDGAAKQYHFGAYATYKANNGFYIDAIAKYLHARDSFDTETTGGYAVTGKGNMDGYSLGVEIGQRLYKDGNKQGWYAEPQAQLTWTHMGDATIRASNGLKTRLGDYDSLLGRASVIIGYSLMNNQNPVDIYFKTGYLHEFNGDTDYTFNNTFRERYNFDSGWWDNGIGFNVQFDGHKNLYLDANYAAGNRFNNWQLNAGYRHQF